MKSWCLWWLEPSNCFILWNDGVGGSQNSSRELWGQPSTPFHWSIPGSVTSPHAVALVALGHPPAQGMLWEVWSCACTTVQPCTNPECFQFLQKQHCQQALGEKGMVQGLHQVFLNTLLTTWNSSDTSGSLLARHLSKCASLQSEIDCPIPTKAEFSKS